MGIYTNFHGNPFQSSWDISARTKAVDQQTDSYVAKSKCVTGTENQVLCIEKQQHPAPVREKSMAAQM